MTLSHRQAQVAELHALAALWGAGFATPLIRSRIEALVHDLYGRTSL